jgi:integrase
VVFSDYFPNIEPDHFEYLFRTGLNLFENGDNLGHTDFDSHGAFPFFDGFLVEPTFRGKAPFFPFFLGFWNLHKRCYTAEWFILYRANVSTFTANKEIRYLRSTFNFERKRKLVADNPLDGIAFLPVAKKAKYVPPTEDIYKVIEVANHETKEYLLAIRETMARVSEINRLTWEDVNFEDKLVILYTRKKKGGHLTPRSVPMTQVLFDVLSHRLQNRDKDKEWVFRHTYRSRKTGELREGPYQNRKMIMQTLCKRAGVRYFHYHALRHPGASLMDTCRVPIGSIQRILGHENRTTTEIYLHSIGESEREAIALFESARQKSHTESHTTDNCSPSIITESRLTH